MTHILAIDPGNVESAYVTVDHDLRPVKFAKLPNEDIRRVLRCNRCHSPFPASVYIEQIAHYGTGMPAGQTVYDTCRWIGRFEEIDGAAALIYRRDVKLHFCHSVKAKDGNVRQALIDRFGDKGTKKQPGWFYGFSADVWQAYALAVYVADKQKAAS